MNPPEDHEIRLVLVGKTGAGKSATGNTIIGEKTFKASARGISTNIGCQHERVVRFGKTLLVIDTPGVFDTGRPQEEIAAEVSKFLMVSAPGPHAIILVTSAAWRFTAEEVDCVRRLKDMFGEGLVRYLFLVITRTEDWEDDNITCKTFLSDLPEEAKCVLKECIEAKKVVAFQNSLRGENGEQQVRDLLTLVSDHIEANRECYYSEKHWEDAERAVQERIKQIMEEEKKKTETLQQVINDKIRQEMNEKLQRIDDQQQKENDAWEQNFWEVQDAMQKEMEDLIKEESNRLKKLGHEGNNKETSGEREKTQAPPESPSKAQRTQSIEKEVMETPAPCHDGASQVTLTTRRQRLIGEPLDGVAILRELSEQRRQEKQQTERILEDFRKTISHFQAGATAQQEMIGLLHEKMEESKQILLESFRREREERERKYTMERKEIEQAHERKKREDEIRFRQMLEMEARDRARKEASHKPFSPFPDFPGGDELRLVFVGKTGSGKSSTASTIAGKKDIFESSARGVSMTISCQCEHFNFDGQKLLLVDTPGIFDTTQSQTDIEGEIGEFVKMSAPGPHAVLFVISAASRFTQEEIGVVKKLKDLFGEAIETYLIIIVTRTEDWEEEGMDVISFLNDLPPEAKRVLGTCIASRRAVAFKNKFTKDGFPKDTDQVRELLALVKNIVRRNGNKCYTEAHWKEAEEEMKRLEQEILEKEMKEERERIKKIQDEENVRLEREYEAEWRRQEKQRKKRERQEKKALKKREREMLLEMEQMQLEMELQIEEERAEIAARAEEERRRTKQLMEEKRRREEEVAAIRARQAEENARQQERMFRERIEQQRQEQERRLQEEIERMRWMARQRAWEAEEKRRREEASCSIS